MSEYKVIKKEIGDLVTYKLYVNDTDYVIEKTYSNDGLIRQFYKSNVSIESVNDSWTNRESKTYTDDIDNILDDDFLFSDFYLAQYRKQKLVGLSDSHMLDVSSNGYDIEMIKSNCIELDGTLKGTLNNSIVLSDAFEIEFTAFFDTSTSEHIISNTGNNRLWRNGTSGFQMRLDSGNTRTLSCSITLNETHTYKIVRDSSGDLEIFLDGVSQDTLAAGDLGDLTARIIAGKDFSTSIGSLNGCLCNLKITDGSTVYHFPMSEGADLVTYDANDKDNYITFDSGAIWSLQDVYHYNMTNGFIGGSEFNGTSSRIQLNSTFANPSENFIIEMEFMPYDLSADRNMLFTGFYITDSNFVYDVGLSSNSVAYDFNINQIYYLELKFIHITSNVYNLNIYINNVYVGVFNNFQFYGVIDIAYQATGFTPLPVNYYYFNGLISYINFNNELIQDFTTQNTTDFTYFNTTEIRLPYSDENGNKTHPNLGGHNNAETLLKMETVITALEDSSFHYTAGVANEISYSDIVDTDNEVFVSQIERSKVNIETFLPANEAFKFKRKSLGFGGLRPFRNLALTIIFLLLSLNLFGQIGLGDNLSFHADINRNLIELSTNASIYETLTNLVYENYNSNIHDYIVTSNAYGTLAQINNYQLEHDNCLHIFPSHFFTGNRSKNILKVNGAINNITCINTYHIDLNVNSGNVAQDCANSWATGYATGLIYNIADTFKSYTERYPLSYELKSLLINTRTSNKFLDTLKAQNNVLNTQIGTIQKGQINSHIIPVNQLCDSVKILMYYNDTLVHYWQVDSLLDTLQIINQDYRHLNESYFTAFNVSNDFNIDVEFVNGLRDSAKYAISYVYYYNESVVPIELISFDSYQENQMIVLKWLTASELNNSHFEIERSNNGLNFETIGTINGNGTTFNTQQYKFIDYSPQSINYYRLKQIDYDGQFEYSFIINQLFKNKECDCVYYRIDGTIATKNSTGLVIEKCCNSVIKRFKI